MPSDEIIFGLAAAAWTWWFVPLCAAARMLAVLTCGCSVVGVTLPWRYRTAFSLLIGVVVGNGAAGDAAEGGCLVLASEVALGAVMGLGAGFLLQGVHLAGELIDDRLRLVDAAGESVFSEGEALGPATRLLGMVAILLVVFGGANGEMPVLEGLLDGFRRVPASKAVVVWDSWRNVLAVFDGALELALRTAAPVLAAMTIVDWCQGLVGRAAATAPAAVAGSAVKPLLGLAVLTATFTGLMGPLTEAVRECLASAAGVAA